MSKTKIKNLSSFTIGIELPNVHFTRDLLPGQEATISEEVVEEFNYDVGCRAFVKDGYVSIYTEDEQLKEQLVTPTADTALDVDIDDLLQNQPINALSAALKKATPALKEKFAERAIALCIADEPHCNILKAYTGVDVIKAINLHHEK